MSSSTMIHGVATRWASRTRITNAASIAPARTSGTSSDPLDASALQRERERFGRARDSVAKTDLPKGRRSLGDLGIVGLEPDLVGGRGHLGGDSVHHGGAARRLLERGHVEVGDGTEVVVHADIL